MNTSIRSFVPVLAASLALVACDGGAITVRSADTAEGGGGGGENGGGQNGGGEHGGIDEGAIDPGRVTLRRLNRAEYNNTVRDLLGIDTRPADNFPPDDFGYGFNNNGDVLTISPLLFEFYEGAAENLIEEALGVAVEPDQTVFEAESLDSTTGGASGDYYNIWSSGEVFGLYDAPADGRYLFRVRACGQLAGPDLPLMELIVEGQSRATYDVGNTCDSPQVFEQEVTLEQGNARFAVAFGNDYYDPDAGADRNLLVDWIEISGPIGVQADGSGRDAIMTCEPQGDGRACARQILSGFAERAWRRPVQAGEIDPLVGLLDVAEQHQGNFEDGIRLGLKAILLSPNFIFRPEFDQGPVGEPHALGDYELASRLSYFLWSTMPDDELLALAASGELNDDDVLRAQVERMLADERSHSLVDNFASQWLYIDEVLNADPDYERFADFDHALKPMMREETRRFVAEVLLGDGTLRDLVAGDFTYVNGALAQHYGIEGVEGEEYQRVTLGAEARRAGMLTQGAWLMARSYPNETSPVVRGFWILENMLCTEPAGEIPQDAMDIQVEGVPEDAPLSAKLAAHRDDPQCAGCHMLMDPLGMAFEHYNPTGAWRETYESNGSAIDTSGQFPDGAAFAGAMELGGMLVDRPEFVPCATEKLMTYALGRGVTHETDHDQIALVAERVRAEGGSTRELIEQIVLSRAFRFRTPAN